MRKIFKAQDESHVEKQWIDDGASVPDGWFASPEAAMAAYAVSGVARDAVSDEAPVPVPETAPEDIAPVEPNLPPVDPFAFETATETYSPPVAGVIDEEPDQAAESPVVTAARLLDPADDSHWTKAGLPDCRVLTEKVGFQVTRKMADDLLPGLTRESAGK